MAKYKDPMLPPRKPQDLVQAQHDKVHKDYAPPGLPQDTLDIIEETKKRATKEGRWK
jgi:hypothetical protein